jgi:hypothetical protein
MCYLNGFIHQVGPQFAYLADCGDKNCADVDASSLSWFKIAQATHKTGMSINDPKAWNMRDTIAGTQSPPGWNVTIPKSLKPGNYIIRHEAIFLRPRGAQFFPNCAHLTITGEGTQSPSADYLVKFPGAYKKSGK